MHHLFLTYDPRDYFSAHVYEQLLAMELLHYGYRWQKGNLGNGYIYVRWDFATFEKIIPLIAIPDLNPIALKNAYEIVRKETETNLIEKPLVEILNFGLPGLDQIRERIMQMPSLADLESLLQQDRSFVFCDDTAILGQRNWPPVWPSLKSITPPSRLLIEETGLIFLTYATNAHNHLDGMGLQKLGQSIVQKAADWGVAFQSILDPGGQLWLSFSVIEPDADKLEILIQECTADYVVAYSELSLPFSPLLAELYHQVDWKSRPDSGPKEGRFRLHNNQIEVY